MRFIRYLNEIKATSYEVDHREDSNRIELWINIGDDPKNIFIVRIGYEGYSKSMLEMKFNISLGKMKENIPYWDINFKDYLGREGIEPKGKGVALRLFAVLEQEIGKLINNRKPEVMRFRVSDSTDSRFKLYKTIARKIEKNGKYKLYTAGKQFWFIRKDLII